MVARSKRAKLLVAALATVAVPALALWAWLAHLERTGRRELEQERAETARSAWPLVPPAPADSPVPADPGGAGLDPRPWWEGISAAELVDAEAPRGGPCDGRLRGGEEALEVELACRHLVRDPRRLAGLTDCERHVLLRIPEVEHVALGLARQVGRYAPLPPRAHAGPDPEALDAALGMPWIGGALQAPRLLCQDAVRHALRGDAGAARDSLELSWRCIELLRTPHSLVFWNVRVLAVGLWSAEGLLPCASVLGGDFDATGLVEALAAFDPRASLRAALVAERGWLDGLFAAFDAPGTGLSIDDPWMADWLWRTRFLDHDRARSLRALRLAIEAVDRLPDLGPFAALDAEVEAEFEGDYADLRRRLGQLLIRPFVFQAESALRAEAHQLLVRAAVLAQRDGAEAARAWLATRADPCGAGPLRARLEEDGILVLWSVGRDGADDPPEGASARRDDVRVLVRAR